MRIWDRFNILNVFLFTAFLVLAGCVQSDLEGDEETTATGGTSANPNSISISLPATSTYINAANETAFTVSGTCNFTGTMVVQDGVAFTSTASCAAGTFSETYNLSGVSEGPVTLVFTYSDTKGSVTAVRTWIKDTIAPTIATFSDGSTTYSTDTANSPAHTFTYTDATSGVDTATIRVSLGTNNVAPANQSVQALEIPDSTTGHTFDGLALAQADGTTYYAHITMDDNAGNTSETFSDGFIVPDDLAFDTGSSTVTVTALPDTSLDVSTDITANNGVGALSYSTVSSSPGITVNSSTGVVTATVAGGTAHVQVTDTASQTSDYFATFSPRALSRTGASTDTTISTTPDTSVDVSAIFSLGVGTVSYAVTSGAGGISVNNSTGVVTTTTTSGSATITALDGAGQSLDHIVNYYQDITVSTAAATGPTGFHMTLTDFYSGGQGTVTASTTPTDYVENNAELYVVDGDPAAHAVTLGDSGSGAGTITYTAVAPAFKMDTTSYVIDETGGGADVGFAHARADGSTIATYQNSTGTVTTVAANGDIRAWYDPSRCTTAAGTYSTCTRKDLGPLLEEDRQNELTYSGDVLAGVTATDWTSTTSFSIDDGTNGPDGATNAYLFVDDNTAATVHNIDQAVTTTAGEYYVFSAYALKKSSDFIALTADDGGGGDETVIFNLNTGAVTDATTGSATPEDYGIYKVLENSDGTWYRVWMIHNATAASTDFRISGSDGTDLTYNGSFQAKFYYWGPQVENVDFTANGKITMLPSSFISTAAAAVTRAVDAVTFNDPTGDTVTDFTYARAGVATRVNKRGVISYVTANTPRFNFDASKCNDGTAVTDQDADCDRLVKGILIEEARTNLVLFSSSLSTNAGWINSGTPTETQNSDSAPDGFVTADTLGDDDGAGNEMRRQSITVADDSSFYTASIFVKKQTGGISHYPGLRVRLIGGSGITQGVVIDNENGTLVDLSTQAPVSSKIEDYGEYYRVSLVTQNDSSGNTTFSIDVFPCIGTALSGATDIGCTGNNVFWGAQVEQGEFVTSYIPTWDAQVTRAADALSVANGEITWLDDTQGTWYAELDTVANGAATVLEVSTASTASISAAVSSSRRANVFIVNTSAQADIEAGSTAADNTLFEMVFSFATNDVEALAEGAAVGTDTTVTLPAVDNGDGGAMTIGNRYGGDHLNGNLNRLFYYSTEFDTIPMTNMTE